MIRWLVATSPLLLGGLLPLDRGVEARWPLGGRWEFPVGGRRDPAIPGPDGTPGYVVTRNIGGAHPHEGADLSNRRGGGAVRVAAHGLVILATTEDPGNGYGLHVVLAHRLPNGGLAYSVYAHLEPRSIRVGTGQVVELGDTLGRVGDTGVATSPHLHFEVRLSLDSSQRWEKGEVADPVTFVASRLPVLDRDSTWAGPYLVWAESAGLLAADDEVHGPLRRGAWRHMLARAIPQYRKPGGDVPGPLDAHLEARGVIGHSDPIDPLEPVDWTEVARDLKRAAAQGVCLPRCRVELGTLETECERRLGSRTPARKLEALARRRDRPSPATACLILAELSLE